ncbi:MAG: hypothetical protein HON78_00200 [Legionellales bacterium]|jgi:hypothetical protein|nr:hypothetical protein [Legionellales bacterium]
MIMLLNYSDRVGGILLNYLQDNNIGHLCLSSSDVARSLSVGQYLQEPCLWLRGNRINVDDINAVYCGRESAAASSKIYCENETDLNYIANSWNSYLQYLLLRIPKKVGVLPANLWSGTMSHLPSLYAVAPKFGLLCPDFYYVDSATGLELSSAKNLFFISDNSVSGIDDFGCFSDDSVFAVVKTSGCWVCVLCVGEQLFALKKQDDDWVPMHLSSSVNSSLCSFLRFFSLNLGQIFLRYNFNLERYYFYGFSFLIMPEFSDYYDGEILISLRQELL